MLYVSLLGRFSISRGACPIAGLEARKLQEVLAYLMIYRDRAHPRERLAELLWGDCDGGQARKGLRQSVWQIQAALERELPGEPPLLLADQEWLQINPASDLRVDVLALADAVGASEGLPGEQLSAAQAAELDRAVACYKGDLLEGCYADWCLFERERLQNILLSTLDKLMGYCEATGRYEGGLRYGFLILGYDLARERTHRRMMRLHYLLGDRTAALRQYRHCVEVLSRELDVPPSARTTSLYQQMCEGDACPARDDLFSLAPAAPSAAELLSELRQLRSALGAVQQRLDQQAAVGRAIGEAGG